MQPDVKLSKFMFHLKFSRKEDYVHEHELYEVMRSRNLYQYQFSVRSNFKKRMRNIEISEKAQKYGFENSRKLFVQKMGLRREHADKLREKNNTLMKRLRADSDDKALTRRYVPIPASTIVYEELPPIKPNAKTPVMSMVSITHLSEGDSSRDTSPGLPATPSAIAATILSVQSTTKPRLKTNNELTYSNVGKTLAPPVSTKKRGSNEGLAKINGAIPVVETSVKCTSLIEGDQCEKIEQNINPRVERKTDVSVEKKDEESDARKSFVEFINNDKTYERREFESKAIKGHGKQHTSTVHFSEDPPEDKAISHTVQSTHGDTISKIETWRERHGLVSKTDLEKDTTFGRVLIDRPSKWTLSHVRNDVNSNTEIGMRYQMLKTSLRKFDNSYNKKSQQLDDLSVKLKIKSQQKVSLPDLETVAKPMVTLDPGGTTPDGRLILTKADYEEYLSDYRKARVLRLERSKKKTKLLYKLIERFTLDPDHRLQDETDLNSGFHTI